MSRIPRDVERSSREQELRRERLGRGDADLRADVLVDAPSASRAMLEPTTLFSASTRAFALRLAQGGEVSMVARLVRRGRRVRG